MLDLDGTLVDASYQHALASYRALRRLDIVLPMWRVHSLVALRERLDETPLGR